MKSIISNFNIDGSLVSADPFGSGHINDTFLVKVESGKGRELRYVLQRINHVIFKNPIAIMDNIDRVTTHIKRKLIESNEKDIERKVLTVIKTRDGKNCVVDPDGNYWRLSLHIDGCKTYDAVETPEQAYETGNAFGNFQKLLIDFPEPRLSETIPDFHNTPKRFKQFLNVLEEDKVNRAKSAEDEIKFVLENESIVYVLIELFEKGEIPERITHNDTKLNNVLIDNKTGECLCVLDLDTVMPGLALYDFGDMVRSATTFAFEDEKDISKVKLEMELFQSLAKGYMDSVGEYLNDVEKKYLPFSGKLITFEQTIRFLTDYLSGDPYYKVDYEDHNLIRTRTQKKLVQSITEHEDEMNKFVESL